MWLDGIKVTFIYGLIDPITGLVRYIGKSNNPRNRLVAHMRTATTYIDKNNKGRWLRKLSRRGLRPYLVILDTVPQESFQEKECWWIRAYRKQGVKLVNTTDGGDGPNGYKHPPHVIEKYARKLRGKPKSPEHRRHLSEARKGRRWGAAERSAIMAGRKANPVCMRRNTAGEANGRAILKTDDVRRIRRWFKGCGTTHKQLATELGVGVGTIEAIRSGRLWPHVK